MGIDGVAEGAEGQVAAAAQGGEDGAFGRGGEGGFGVVELADRFERVGAGLEASTVVERGFGVCGEHFEAEGALAGCGAEFVDREALVDVLGAAEAVETGGGEDERVGFAGGPFAKAGVDVAAHGDEPEIGAQGEQHGLAARAGGGDAGAERKHVEAPELFANEGIAGVGAGGDGGKSKARVERGGEVFERVDGDVDAAVEEGVFDFLDEDALGVEWGAVVEGGGGDEAGVLHAVAGGADDLDLDGMAVAAEVFGDVVGLPEGELGASGADADR